MSEFISMATHLHTKPERINAIVQIVIDFFQGEDVEILRKRLQDELGSITSSEFAYAAQLFAEGHVSEYDFEFKQRHELMIHTIFDEAMGTAAIGTLPDGHPIHTFLQENMAINRLVNEIRAVAEKTTLENFDAAWWTAAYDKLWQVNTHYVRKENQLFPFLEKKGFDRPSTVMWAVHDNIRAMIKQQRQHLEAGNYVAFSAGLAQTLHAVEDMTFKEEKVLLPTSKEMLTEEEWLEIRRGEAEVGYCLIAPPPDWSPEIAAASVQTSAPSVPKPAEKRRKPFTPPAKKRSSLGAVNLSKGFLTPVQINQLFKHLPVDVTFVDEFDQVKFYNRGEERVFSRSPGIIDREVRYCHPPKSVHVVERIVAGFKSGERDTAEFWIQMGESFVHIRYFAVRDDEGNYKGVLEITQDATEIRSFDGEM